MHRQPAAKRIVHLFVAALAISCGVLSGAVAGETPETDPRFRATRAGHFFVRGPYLQAGTPSGVCVKWETSEPGPSVVEYGPDGAFDLSATGVAGTSHEVHITGLSAGRRYAYRVAESAASHQFRTHTLPGSVDKFTFAVVGDFGTGEAESYTVMQQIRNAGVDFIITTGDNAYPDGTSFELQRNLFDVYRDVLHSAFLYPSLGNHDKHSAGAQPYRDAFHLFSNGLDSEASEYFYSFDYGDIHFVALDSSIEYMTAALWEAQKTWLERDLASTKQQWKIVYLHHPAYSSLTKSHKKEVPIVLRDIVPILEKHGVDVVCAGHEHIYEQFSLIYEGVRDDVRGIKYYVCGHGGAGLTPFADGPHPLSIERNNWTFGFLKCAYDGSSRELTIEPIDSKGRLMGTPWKKRKGDPARRGD